MNIKTSKRWRTGLSFAVCSLACSVTLSSCNDYLEVYPENALPTDKYWASKADVEATLMTGYLYLRQSVTSSLIPWGELRAGYINNSKGSPLQKFEIKTTSSVVNWAPMYKIVNTANLVLKNAGKARENDDTYTENELKSHLCEAYWQRALAYFYIVRNWREAPLFTQPFETDDIAYSAPKASEAELMAQIKQDLLTAIELDAAKESFNTTWETKGRATKWAIYALMTDVCMWNQEFDEAINYANAILNSTAKTAPAFLAAPTHSTWFSIFNPGNSLESIYEVQWSADKSDGSSAFQNNDLPILFDDQRTEGVYRYSERMVKEFQSDYTEIMSKFDPTGSGTVIINDETYVRTKFGGIDNSVVNTAAKSGLVWKYLGSQTINEKRNETDRDPNFIIYRVADIMLLKAEALLMRKLGTSAQDNQDALAIINQIRQRTNLPDINYGTGMTFTALLNALTHERRVELAGEGKAWYDLLRMARYQDPSGQVNFKQDYFIDVVITYNEKAKATWITTVLNNENAWYLPIYDNEIRANSLLVQNPYYE